ncbi:hypothetical protein COW36_20105 [bacterium (Candidatus Blackallbacteria) CG17_big_fil_post_rev_8_21_14_2_50_48_46]|uniref:Aminoglycoside phosphotransferase domain-containing protein n=1 Tax=bacterium (Candidatus Blackallbacteria) CG17_big_fil_post_rev_8_21_14_2_50_48_46 TaxID=2014261 RepID=A0A2M7G0G5_9BACT|nr:MAG: hypothetical protein COW64_22430 [bacterium (Candidatus Blackallbacteria) CG18_big_fil_WC_8_21_14_2_50_49_26]PIW14712.1 MAG: hypothetical protein COW36_20105 [bacterium (Candidatus Blackallbacteria) CG17_big_fil_post_rev_8_21_14_2_50_48_46]PIW50814.1 MAG: hypothetical protein COW20_00920 [bacterium (Candidatus Blackallbacteria) CG13_big_fil_rev_8_21_14_2_50_49_14]
MTAPLWQAEYEISHAQAQALISRQFPELCPLELHYLGQGWDNQVFSVNQDWLFRFPRRKIALDLLATELKLLKPLAEVLPLQIPVPQFLGQPADDYPWPFAGYHLISGQSACQCALSPAERRAMAPRLADLLKSLHTRPTAWREHYQIPPDRLQKVNLAERLPQTRERLREARDKRLLEEIEPFEHFLAGLPAETPSDRPKALVHGDLYLRHLIVNENHDLVGIIDWGDAHWGDPATDLSLVFAFLPPSARPAFWQSYGEVSELTQNLARFRAIFHSLALLLYAEDTADTLLFNEARRSLGWILSEQID